MSQKELHRLNHPGGENARITARSRRYVQSRALKGQNRNSVLVDLRCELPEAVQGGISSLNSVSVELTFSL